MELQERLGSLEEELNLLKVEIKTVLVDLREELLKHDGPMAEHESPVIDFVSAAHAQRSYPGLQPSPDGGQATWELPQQPGSAAMHYAAAYDERPAIDFTNQQGSVSAAPHMPPQGAAGRQNSELTWGVVQIASLGKWAEMAARRIGRERLEEVLAVHELLTGRHDASVREALLRMVDLCGEHATPAEVDMNDVLAVLAQLDALFRSHSLSEVTVLSMLSEVA